MLTQMNMSCTIALPIDSDMCTELQRSITLFESLALYIVQLRHLSPDYVRDNGINIEISADEVQN